MEANFNRKQCLRDILDLQVRLIMGYNVAKVWLGAYERIWRSYSLWGEETCLVLSSTSHRQLCAVALPKIIFVNFLGSLPFAYDV